MVEQAQTLKPPIQRIADVISSYFTPVVLVLAVAVFAAWCAAGGSGSVDTDGLHFVPFALQFSITVLVVSCPCAIGLASPTAIMVGTGVAARKGILFKGGPAVEACHKVNVLIFDKTGTLTVGKPTVTDCEFLDDSVDAETFWHVVGSAESASEHALARAIVEHAKQRPGPPLVEPEDFEAVPGQGMSCSVGGWRVLVGNRKFVTEQVSIPEEAESNARELEQQGKTVIWVLLNEQLAGYVALADSARPEAHAVVRQLQQMGIEVWMVSGDNTRTVNAIAAQLGIDNAIGDVLPGGKADKVRELQAQQRPGKWWQLWRKQHTVVGMVGDGVNDSPALTQADAGIAVGAGTDIALQAADVVLVKSDMRDILLALHLSRTTFRRILVNFGWAFLYNATAIPLAAGVLYPATAYAFPPAIAGLSEIVSTLPVLFSFLHDYQQNRVLIFLDPESDPLGTGYHISQSKIAIGSGGIGGKGYLQGSQSHLDYLPEGHTDFVFATMAEEWGLIGGLFVIVMFALLLRWSTVVSLNAPSRFGKLAGGGLTMVIFFYIAINMLMVMGLAPVVGIPLPFLSYGGSSMMTIMICIGLLMGIERNTRQGGGGGRLLP